MGNIIPDLATHISRPFVSSDKIKNAYYVKKKKHDDS